MHSFIYLNLKKIINKKYIKGFKRNFLIKFYHLSKIMQQKIQQRLISQTEIEIKRQIKAIYTTLIKLGYPKILELSLDKIQQIQTYLASYFVSTPSRLLLIQWLVAVIFPEYREMPWYITQKDTLKKILKALWKVGVMPVNKHTKNLDYVKYVQGTLGYENAVSLIYNLTELAFQTILNKKSKPDVSFGQFFHQLIDNFTQLVNQNYDVYGITFPCKFISPNSANTLLLTSQSLKPQQKSQTSYQNQQYLTQFQKQYDQFYKDKMLPLLQKQDQLFDKIYGKKKQKTFVQQKLTKLNNSSNKKQMKTEQQEGQKQNESQLATFIDNLNKHGKLYHQKYNKLIAKIQDLLQKPQTKSRLLPYYISKKQQEINSLADKQSDNQNLQYLQKNKIKQDIQRRSIKITPQFCQKYKNYKKLIRKIKVTKDDQQFIQKRLQILNSLYQINQNICI